MAISRLMSLKLAINVYTFYINKKYIVLFYNHKGAVLPKAHSDQRGTSSRTATSGNFTAETGLLT